MTVGQHMSRRRLLAGTAAAGAVEGVGAALTACGADEGTASVQNDQLITLAATTVPVGGATIVGDAVVSQPTAGDYKAFSAVCTHESCLVSRVQGATVICPCHQSVFSAKDGSVVSGPARRPLPTRTVSLAGETLTVA